MRSKAVGDIINFFREVIAGEKRASELKRELAHSKGFRTDGLFRIVAGKEGYISIESMKAFVREKIACNDREVYELFEKFDHRRCGVITAKDFGEEVG